MAFGLKIEWVLAFFVLHLVYNTYFNEGFLRYKERYKIFQVKLVLPSFDRVVPCVHCVLHKLLFSNTVRC